MSRMTGKGCPLSRALTKLYRLAYESMEDVYDSNELQTKYEAIYTEFATILPIKEYPVPHSSKALLDIIAKLLVNEDDSNLFGKRDESISDLDAKVALVEYCIQDNIDQALLLVLNYKLKHKSATNIVNYIDEEFVNDYGDEEEFAAIHKAIEKIQDANTKYNRTVFLIEETQAVRLCSKWRWLVTIPMYCEQCSNMEQISILTWHVVVDGVNVGMERGKPQPLHTAIQNCNYDLAKVIIERGANINSSRTVNRINYELDLEFQDDERTALYLICSELSDDNKMLKLVMQTHDQKRNGIPDVNKLNCLVDEKPSDDNEEPSDHVNNPNASDKQENGEGDKKDTEDPDTSDEEEEELEEPYVYSYETAMHVAVRKCDIEMIKLLLIYIGTTYNALQRYESVKNVYQILEESSGDHTVKA
eukprot:88560_1